MASFDIKFLARTTAANPDTIRERSEELDTLQARLLGRADDLGSTFYDTATQFTDLMAWGIGKQTDEELQIWKNAGAAIAYASSMVELWAQYVADFKEERSEQMSEWWEFLRNKKAEIPDKYQGDTITASHPEKDGLGFLGDANKCRSIYDEVVAKVADLEERERTNYQAFEDHADEVADDLREGPTKENVQALIDAGINSWAFYNIDPSRYTMMVDAIELDEADGQEWADELESYWSGDKPIDERYNELMLMLSMVTTNAMQAQQGETSYREEEMDFLEAFYDALEEEGPNGRGVIGIPSVLEGEHLSDEEREHALGVLGDGVLALSDPEIGGGYEKIPESVRNAIDLPFAYHDGNHQGGMYADPLGTQESDARTMGDLSELFAHSSDDLEGGYGFSTNLSLSLGTFMETWGSGSDPWVTSEELAELVDVASRNKDANSFLLTGEHVDGAEEPGVDYRSDYRDVAVEGILTYEWHDEGATARQITDWMAEDLNSDNPEDRVRAQKAFSGFMETITDPEMHSALTKTGVSVEEGESLYTNASFSQYNISLANSFADIFDSHIYSFSTGEVVDAHGNPTTGIGEYDPDRGFVEMGSLERANFMQYLAGNDETAARLVESVDIYQQVELMAYLEGDSPAESSARGAGSIQGLLEQALQMESDDRYADNQERIDRHKQVLSFGLSEAADKASKLPTIGTAISKGMGLATDSIVDSVIDGEIDVSPRHSSYTDPEDFERNVRLGVLDYMTNSDQGLDALNQVHRSGAFGGLVEGGAISVEVEGNALSADEVSSEDFIFDSSVNVTVENDSSKWNEGYRENDPINVMDGHLGNVLNENVEFSFGDGESYSASTVVSSYEDQFNTRKGNVENAFSDESEKQ